MAATVAVIHDRLRTAILSGELTPGEAATQIGLADRLGVSRTPLREALRMLEQEGLLLRESNGRIRISPLSIDHLEELTLMRINLQSIAVRLTVPRFANADHARLEGWLAEIDRYALVQDWNEIEAPHRKFHAMLVSGAGDHIVALLGQLWDHASRYRKIGFRLAADNSQTWEMRSIEHRLIVDACESYDAATAANYAGAQIARSAIAVAEQLDPQHPLNRVHKTFDSYISQVPVTVK
jgi:DNA-binding GntR family transcriptional regulator